MRNANAAVCRELARVIREIAWAVRVLAPDDPELDALADGLVQRSLDLLALAQRQEGKATGRITVYTHRVAQRPKNPRDVH